MSRTAQRRTTPVVALVAIAFLLALVHPQRAEAASYPTPTGFVVLSTTTTSASLDWKKITGASGYRVRYATSSTMTGAKSAAFRYSNGVVTGLTAGTKYWFRIAVAATYGTGAAQSPYTPSPYLQGRTQPAPSSSPGSYDLQVASFNISGILNDSTAPQPWAERKAKVAQQLLGAGPSDEPFAPADVIAVQEANTTRVYGGLTQYTDLVQTLNDNRPSGSTAHYAAILDSSMSTRIVYNDTVLSLVAHDSFKWASQETVHDGLRYMPWAIFQVRSTGDRFFFASDHLETSNEPVRRAQWQQLINVLPALTQGLPAIFGGDFNSPRGAASGTLVNPTGSVMLPKMGPAGYPDTLGQAGRGNYYISTSRALHVTKGNINSVNKYSRNLGWYPNTDIIGQSVDYLFASSALAVKQWALIADDGGDYVLDGVVPSDHNMIRATITIP